MSARSSSLRAQPPEEPHRREPRPREERVPELPDVEAEARVVALVGVVHVGERAVEHVVEDEPVGERRPVAHVHRDVPGQRHREDDEQPGDDLELDDLAHDAQQAREDVLARARRREVRQRDEHRQTEARRPLAQRGDGREKPPAQVREAPDAALAPAQVEQRRRATQPPRSAPAPRARRRRRGASSDAAERVGVGRDRVRDARGLRDAAVLVAGQPAVAAARAAAKLVPVRVEAVRAGAPEKLEVARERGTGSAGRRRRGSRRRPGATP